MNQSRELGYIERTEHMTIDAGQYNIDKIIRESSWFSHLPQKAPQKLAVSAQIKRYATSDYLYRVGEKTS